MLQDSASMISMESSKKTLLHKNNSESKSCDVLVPMFHQHHSTSFFRSELLCHSLNLWWFVLGGPEVISLLVLLSEEMMPRIQSSTCTFGNLMKDDLAATKSKKQTLGAAVIHRCVWGVWLYESKFRRSEFSTSSTKKQYKMRPSQSGNWQFGWFPCRNEICYPAKQVILETTFSMAVKSEQGSPWGVSMGIHLSHFVPNSIQTHCNFRGDNNPPFLNHHERVSCSTRCCDHSQSFMDQFWSTNMTAVFDIFRPFGSQRFFHIWKWRNHLGNAILLATSNLLGGRLPGSLQPCVVAMVVDETDQLLDESSQSGSKHSFFFKTGLGYHRLPSIDGWSL